MRMLSAAGVLDLCERGAALHPLDRGLLALAAADAAAAGAADWPLGRRNRTLLEVHAAWFGPRLEGWTACPACGDKAEFELDARLLAAGDAAVPDAVQVGDFAFRLPTTRDLAHAVAAGGGAADLLERCRIGDATPREWTGDQVGALEARLSAADPLADTRLALTCPSCGHEWEDGFDIGRFLWAEVEAVARRLLWEVHTLATAYGWTEAETLALGAGRRAMYLRLVQA